MRSGDWNRSTSAVCAALWESRMGRKLTLSRGEATSAGDLAVEVAARPWASSGVGLVGGGASGGGGVRARMEVVLIS